MTLGLQRGSVKLVPHSNEWGTLFEEERKEYAALKSTLAEKHESDRDAYTRGKAEFIRGVVELARTELERWRLLVWGLLAGSLTEDELLGGICSLVQDVRSFKNSVANR